METVFFRCHRLVKYGAGFYVAFRNETYIAV